jgi:hypothetical protein
MKVSITGGCLCGAVRYAYDGELGPAGYCHCADCRRVSGSAYGVSLSVDASGFRVTRGEPRSFTKTGDSGRPVARHFCGNCGSPLFTSPPLHPDRVFIKAGSLDDPNIVSPEREAWTDSRVAWAAIAPGLKRYAKNRA